MTSLGAQGDHVQWPSPPLINTDNGVVPAGSRFGRVDSVIFGKIFVRFWIAENRTWSEPQYVIDDRIPTPWSGSTEGT